MPVTIWADGSCQGNGTATSVAACRIVTEDGLEATYPLGSGLTNNVSEVEAIRKALEYAITAELKDVRVLSDSKCALSWIARGEKNGAENCISKESTLPEGRKAVIRYIVGSILEMKNRIPEVTIEWVAGQEQRADFFEVKGRKKPKWT